MKSFSSKIDNLVELRSVFRGLDFEKAVSAAHLANPWFAPYMVERAVEAICSEMLSREKLRLWLSCYEMPRDFQPRRVGIIAAGNLPLVGFYDLLCAFVSGHSITLKPSSKDRVLMEYVSGHLANISGVDIDLVSEIDRYDIDYLIATGSDATAQSVSEKYKGIPSIIRGTRHSVARLTGSETEDELRGLGDDMFLYWGLGCRSISHLYVPENYDFQPLMNIVKPHSDQYFAQKVRYEKALLDMRGAPYLQGENYLLQELSPLQTPPVGIVGYSHYTATPTLDPQTIQCTVGFENLSCNVPFGQTQKPSLLDAPNGIDVIKFLL